MPALYKDSLNVSTKFDGMMAGGGRTHKPARHHGGTRLGQV